MSVCLPPIIAHYNYCFIGCIAAQDQGRCPIQSWTANKAYEFEYHGRLLTGLPSLASHYSGVGMRATVKVYAKDANILVLQVQAAKYVDINQVLHPKERGADSSYRVDGWNWRNLYLPPFKDVSHIYIYVKIGIAHVLIYIVLVITYFNISYHFFTGSSRAG